ncbi:MAG: hypothetical protein ACE5GL_01680 [Calditrichia bacterium]
MFSLIWNNYTFSLNKIKLDVKNYTCPKCGENTRVDYRCSYSKTGKILLGIGISARPIRVDFKCRGCGEILESSTNPEVLKKYVGR